jgi:hypothetical protein
MVRWPSLCGGLSHAGVAVHDGTGPGGLPGPYRHVTKAGYGPTLRVTMSVWFFCPLVTAKNGKRADPLEPSPS